RDRFKSLCSGAVLLSEMADSADKLGLNANYDQALARIHTVQASADAGKLTAAKSLGVCSLRSYIRRNYIHRMYQDYSEQGSN
ncbi:MAG: hypothetical protein ACXVB9_08550, partial [Bdellovibrionota bacterium]